MSFARPSLRLNRAADAVAREIVARIARWLLLGLGGLLIIAGVAIAPLPGPLGMPLVVIGLMIVLRNSFAAKRQFVRFQRAQPKMAFPIRRLLRREPEVVLVFWQQYLRVERIVLPRKRRFSVKARRSLKRKLRARFGGPSARPVAHEAQASAAQPRAAPSSEAKAAPTQSPREASAREPEQISG